MADVIPAILALTPGGAVLGARIAAALGGTLHGRAGRVDAPVCFAKAPDHIRDLFAAGVPVIGVCAAGILIRAVAPLLADKRDEPPVIAVAEDGSAVIPLLGGHRGANALAARIGAVLGVRPAVTTAGELALGLALDAPPAGWRLANPEHAASAMADALAGDGLVGGGLVGAGPWPDLAMPGGPRPWTLCTTTAPHAGARTLVYHPQIFTLGLGASRGCPEGELAVLVDAALAEAGVAPGAVAAVGTLDLKADEGAILAAADRLGVPLRLFSADRLAAEGPRIASPSAIVAAEVGTPSVAEAAALALAGPDGALVVAKRKSAHGTVALARAPAPVTEFAGRPRGQVALVGIGPGQAAWRTPEASRLIVQADLLVGYGLYIDLLGPLARGKARADFPLGGEEARCRHALEAAGEGASVALVCSGDAGIYAMGALVYELLDRADSRLSDAARRVGVISAPGISALQAAAARVGAPLGHDFCAISLSDLLTPRVEILRRLRAAAEGDFVIALYNPVSRTRRTLLEEARAILAAHRPPDTPVILAASLGRAEERILHRTLATLRVDEVDMLTLVLIGSSQTRAIARGDGTVVYTPRGYAHKLAEAPI